MVGVIIVGLSNIHSYNNQFAPNPLLGNSLCLIGQLFLAGMFVYEEKILKEFDIHVFDIVGWEGVWGILISAIFLSLFFLIPGHDFGSFENPMQASIQVFKNNFLLISLLVSIFVIGPFNYYGTNLTKYSSAMHRCLIDASRMCVVWVISIVYGWEHFCYIQGIGYLIILVGNLLYFEVISTSCIRSLRDEQQSGENNIENDSNSNFKCFGSCFICFFKSKTKNDTAKNEKIKEDLKNENCIENDDQLKLLVNNNNSNK